MMEVYEYTNWQNQMKYRWQTALMSTTGRGLRCHGSGVAISREQARQECVKAVDHRFTRIGKSSGPPMPL